MTINLELDKKIFVMFLLINAAGYDYENNLKGFHPVRKAFRRKFFNLAKRDIFIDKAINFIKRFPLRTEEYIRLVNLIILPDKTSLFADIKKSKVIYTKWKEFLPIFNQIVNKKEISILFNDYAKKIEKLQEYKIAKVRKELLTVVKFFNLKALPLEMRIHLNLLDSYSRGTNYFTPKIKYISLSLNNKNKINWPTLRHEFIHILLKYVFNNDMRRLKISVPVNKNYAVDTLRTKFDENFVIAANLFFLKDDIKIKNNLKFYFDKGFKKIYIFYSFIDNSFVKNKQKLSPLVLNQLIGQLK